MNEKRNRIRRRPHRAFRRRRRRSSSSRSTTCTTARPGRAVGQSPRRLHGAVVHRAGLPDRPLAQDHRSAVRRQSQVRVLPVGRVPARQATGTEPAVHGHWNWRAKRWPSTICNWNTISTWMSNRDWATAAWGGWPPASSTRWPRSTSRPSVTAFATSSASFARRSKTAGRWRSRTAGSVGQPLGVPPVGRHGAGRFLGTHGNVRGGERQHADAVGTQPRSVGRTVHDPRARLPDQDGQHPASVAARATEEFDFQLFDIGDYTRAVDEKVQSETISKVLYPNDANPNGRQLRLKQQYFFVACSLHDILRRFRLKNDDWSRLPEKVAIQLNDTHPVVAIPELMRLLVDVYQLDWDHAWHITRQDDGLHLPHAVARSPGEMAGRSVRQPAAAPPGDHLRDQSAIPGGGAGPLSRRRCAHRADVDHRGAADAADAHGAPGDDRQPGRQRRGGTAFATAARSHVEGFRRDVARAVPEQDERRHAAAFHATGQPGPVAADHVEDRRRLADGSGTTARAGTVCRRSGVPGRLAGREAAEQAATGRGSADDLRRGRQRRLDLRRHGQAAARIQAATAQGAAHHLALSPPQGESRRCR